MGDKILKATLRCFLTMALLLFLAPLSFAAISDGIQAHYGMENYTDYTGNYPDFTLNNGASQVNDSHCIVGGCIDFDGSNDYLNFTTEVTNYTTMTINMFIHWHDATRDHSYGKYSMDGGVDFITIEQFADPGSISLRHYVNNVWQYDSPYDNSFIDNEEEEEQMFTVVQEPKDGGTYYAITIYYEGVKAGSMNISTGESMNNGWTDYIGWGTVPGLSARWFNGDVDEFTVWNRALEPAEIARVWAIYEGGETVFNYSDPNPPVCIGFQNVTANGNLTYNWSLSCSDDFFYSFYVSCNNTNSYNYNETGINNASYTFNETVVFNSTALCQYEYCDGHTDDKLKDEFKALQKDLKSVDFKPDGVNIASLVLTDQDDYELSTEKKKDRYTFTIINKDKTKEKKAKKYTLEYSTPDGEYIDSPLYDGWIIDKKLKTWFDLETEQQASISMQKVKSDTWRFEIDTEADSITFNSIGALNCVNETTLFTISPTTPPDNDTNTTTTTTTEDTTGIAATLKNISLLAIWLLLVVYLNGLRSANQDVPQLINIIALAIGFTAGLLWLDVAGLIGLVLMFSSTVAFFYFTRKA